MISIRDALDMEITENQALTDILLEIGIFPQEVLISK